MCVDALIKSWNESEWIHQLGLNLAFSDTRCQAIQSMDGVVVMAKEKENTFSPRIKTNQAEPRRNETSQLGGFFPCNELHKWLFD